MPMDPDHQEQDRRRYLEVAEEIIRSVALGALRPGDRLPNERELALRCNASRATVREALLALELGGVLEARRGAGHYLTGIGVAARAPAAASSDAPPRELLEVRRILEPAASRLSAMCIRPSQVAALRAVLERTEALIDAENERDLDELVVLNLTFHRELASTSGNSALAEVVSHLVDASEHPLWRLVDRIVIRNPSIRHQQLAEHRAVLAAVVSGPPEKAASTMAVHLGALSERMFGLTNMGLAVSRARPR